MHEGWEQTFVGYTVIETIFAENFARNLEKSKTWTSDTCSMSHLSHRANEPASQPVIL